MLLEDRYKAYVIDGLHDPVTAEFLVLENISTRDVHIKRRASISGALVAGTLVIVTANGSPTSIFGERRGYIIKGRWNTYSRDTSNCDSK